MGCRFSIITPTYNRAHLLGQTYQSLCGQTFRDFEWIVVDDGSTDGTKELVASWSSSFPIRYFRQPNSGMHVALNVGYAQARGEFLTQVDDDDWIVPNALERFDYHWRSIPNPGRFASLAALCYQRDGVTLLGNPFPRDCMDTFTLTDYLAVAGQFDRWGIIRADVLRKFPFPVFKGEIFSDPGIVWNRIMRRYATRWVNEPFKVCGYAPGHMSSHDHRWANPKGAVLYNWELLWSDVPLKMRAKAALNVLRFAAVATLRALRKSS